MRTDLYNASHQNSCNAGLKIILKTPLLMSNITRTKYMLLTKVRIVQTCWAFMASVILLQIFYFL